ncbi:MAG TPA: hypothetical protein PLW14_10010 [Chlorobiota bacterium]|nr:hypothetical protein [Chlorobiota bacterium]
MNILFRSLAVAILISGSVAGALAQTQTRAVVGAGSATNTLQDGRVIQHTLGQSVVGRSAIGDDKSYGGFWYRPRRGVVIVAVPNGDGDIGTTVNVPIMLVRSDELLVDGPRQFEVELRYNATVLVHQGSFQCRREGDDCILTITGTMADSAGILATVPFLVTLGNSETTPLTIDTVKWTSASTFRTETQNGTFQVLGVCREGDVVRLIKRSRAAGISGVTPNPAASDATVMLDLAERGRTRLYVVDAIGREIAVLSDEDRAPGVASVPIDVSTIASGTYTLVLMTPNELFTKPLVIRK